MNRIMGNGNWIRSLVLRFHGILLLCLTILPVIIISSHTGEIADQVEVDEVFYPEDYEWKTGDWQDCVHGRCGYGGQQKRNVWCVTLTGERMPSTRCAHIPPPVPYQICFQVCFQQKTEVAWRMSAWTNCMPASQQRIHDLVSLTVINKRSNTQSCVRNDGVQLRSVTCNYLMTGDVLPDSVCEHFTSKPHSEQVCDFNCSQDCVVGNFTEWSSCDGCLFVNRTRVRRLFIAPMNGGITCPLLTQTEHCPYCKTTYRFSVTPWTECKAFHLKNPDKQNRSHPLIGYQSRQVLCIDIHGQKVGHRHCLDMYHMPELRNHRSCVMSQDCLVSEWLNWQPINNTCKARDGSDIPGYMSRRRRVMEMPFGTGQKCPKLHDTFQVIGETLTKCHRYEWIVSPWSVCKLLGDSAGIMNRAEQCGPGVQSRKVFCVRKTDGYKVVPVTAELCPMPKPAFMEHCQIRCTQNCTVSEWSVWQPCLPDPCLEHKNTKQENHRSRFRDIVQPLGGFGLPCPHLAESRPCESVLCYQWSSTTIGAPCQLFEPAKGCGPGVERRNITCMSRNRTLSQDNDCIKWTSQSRPSSSMPCTVPCPYDCVVSKWAQWSPCSQNCNSREQHFRKRTKSILSRPAFDGQVCPLAKDLTQMEACARPFDCETYTWETSNWGSCVIKKRSLTCGAGRQSRAVYCYQSGGELVQKKRCSRSLKPNTTRDCQVLCAQNCKLTAWSDWSRCSNTCQKVSISGGNIPFQTRRKYVIKLPERGGKPCPHDVLDIKRCLDMPPCLNHQWVTSHWSECVLPPHYIYCGDGLKARNVTCQDNNGVLVSPDVCLTKVGVMPTVTHACQVTCDNHCKLTDWSDFGPCVGGCTGVRIRTRTLIGGSRENHLCRNMQKYPLVDRIPCQCYDYEPVAMGPWSDCIIQDWSGSTSRNHNGPDIVYGKDHDEPSHELDPSHVDTDMEFVSTLSETETEVNVGSSNAENSITESDEWGNTEEYDPSYMETIPMMPLKEKQHRYDNVFIPKNSRRVRKYLDSRRSAQKKGRNYKAKYEKYSAKRKKKKNSEMDKKSVDEDRQKLLEDFPFREMGPAKKICGGGASFQVQGCKREPGVVESAVSCSLSPYREEMCIIPCPVDCEMSEWSAWSSCSVTCGDGFRLQSRTVLKPSQNNGRECPVVETMEEFQTKVCSMACDMNMWRVFDWGPCITHKTSQAGEILCGVGVQSRAVECLTLHADGDWQKTADYYCRELPKPPASDMCYIACPGDCVVSNWSQWTSCNKTCADHISRQRTRMILRRPAVGKTPCLPVLEEQACIQGENCFDIDWEFSDWSSCTMEEGNSYCGLGWQERFHICSSPDGAVVDRRVCDEKRGSPMPGLLRQRCEIPCDIDCVVSDWGYWSQCSATRGLGEMTRNRHIMHKPSGRGRRCPADIIQHKGCFLHASYQLVVSNWSSCFEHAGMCGHGTMTRSVTCVSENNIPVDITRCTQGTDVPIIQTEKSCEVLCPGECLYTEWMEWSDCHIDCDKYNQGQRAGVKSRSRGILLPSSGNHMPCGLLWNYRGCDALECYSFLWQTTEWHNGERCVWCERSDGLNATGGCDCRTEPARTLTCNPTCDVTHSYCHDTDLCSCRKPYLPVYRYGNGKTLIECTMDGNQTVVAGSSMAAIYYPLDGPTNFWMHAVIAAGSAFVIFVVAVLYAIWYRRRIKQLKLESGNTGKEKVTGSKSNAIDTKSVSSSLNCDPHETQPLIGHVTDELKDSNNIQELREGNSLVASVDPAKPETEPVPVRFNSGLTTELKESTGGPIYSEPTSVIGRNKELQGSSPVPNHNTLQMFNVDKKSQHQPIISESRLNQPITVEHNSVCESSLTPPLYTLPKSALSRPAKFNLESPPSKLPQSEDKKPSSSGNHVCGSKLLSSPSTKYNEKIDETKSPIQRLSPDMNATVSGISRTQPVENRYIIPAISNNNNNNNNDTSVLKTNITNSLVPESTAPIANDKVNKLNVSVDVHSPSKACPISVVNTAEQPNIHGHISHPLPHVDKGQILDMGHLKAPPNAKLQARKYLNNVAKEPQGKSDTNSSSSNKRHNGIHTGPFNGLVNNHHYPVSDRKPSIIIDAGDGRSGTRSDICVDVPPPVMNNSNDQISSANEKNQQKFDKMCDVLSVHNHLYPNSNISEYRKSAGDINYLSHNFLTADDKKLSKSSRNFNHLKSPNDNGGTTVRKNAEAKNRDLTFISNDSLDSDSDLEQSIPLEEPGLLEERPLVMCTDL